MLWFSAVVMVASAVVTALLVARDPLLRDPARTRGERWGIAALWLGIAPAGVTAVALKGVEAGDRPLVFAIIAMLYVGLCVFSGARPALVMAQLFDDEKVEGFTPELRHRGVRALLLTVCLVVVGIVVLVSLGPPDL